MRYVDELEELRVLHGAVLHAARRILELLSSKHTSGRVLPPGFVSGARDAIRDAISLAETTAEELRAFQRELEALEREVRARELTDRSLIVGRIEDIHNTIWHRKMDLRSMLERTWGFNLDP